MNIKYRMRNPLRSVASIIYCDMAGTLISPNNYSPVSLCMTCCIFNLFSFKEYFLINVEMI